MNVQLATMKDMKHLADFLAIRNMNKTQHIGYVGHKQAEIFAALEEDFKQEDGTLSFVIAKNDAQQIIGTIGVEIDGDTAEVWGPFSPDDEQEMIQTMWQRLTEAFLAIQTFYFFINKENRTQQAFVQQIGAKNSGSHLLLTLQREDFHTKQLAPLQAFELSDAEIFERLHNDTFVDTYYDAQTIISRLSETNRLFVLKESGIFIGYGYFEVAPAFGEASLEYVAIDPHYQNQGYGTALLTAILEQLFKYDGINDLTLCVSNTNDQANRVYEKVGFLLKDELISYTLHS